MEFGSWENTCFVKEDDVQFLILDERLEFENFVSYSVGIPQ